MKFVTNFLNVVRIAVPTGVLLVALPINALTLQDAIKETLDNNPDIQAARQEILAREHEIRGAKAGYLPTLNAEAGVGREWTRSQSTGNVGVTLTREEAALRLRQMVYDGNAVGSEVDRQRARYESAIYTAIDTQENVSLRASQAYINVLRQAELFALLVESLEEHESIYQKVKERAESGKDSLANLEQISVRRSLAKNNVIAGRNNLNNALSQYQGLVGTLPRPQNMEKPVISSLPSSLDESLAIALADHPTIKSATADIKAAEAQHAASKSKRHPTLHIEGDRTWNEDIDGTVGENEDWVLALRLRYNIYNGGRDSSRRKQTSELLQQAKQVFRGAQWETEEGMRLSWYAYVATEQQLEHLKVHVNAIEKTKKAYREQYEIEKRTLLDLLNTEGEVIRAKQTFVNTYYDQMYSKIRVLNSSGQLTKALGVE